MTILNLMKEKEEKNLETIPVEKEPLIFQKIEQINFSKQKILLNICMKMIEFEIPKTTIKNICDEINEKIFENNNELAEQTKATYINYITSAKFVSKIVI